MNPIRLQALAPHPNPLPQRAEKTSTLFVAAMLLLTMLTTIVSAQDLQTFEQRRDWYLRLAREQAPKRHRVQPDGSVKFSAPDPGKLLWWYVLAHLQEDPSGSSQIPESPLTARQLAAKLARFPNMFHFNADGPAACLLKFPGVISPEDRLTLYNGHAKAIFRRDDEPNHGLYLAQGTENHLMMSRFAGYLFAQEWLRDHPNDEQAKTALAQAREFILRQARDVVRHGPGEFNSTTYYGYQVRGVFACFDHAEDPEVREASRAILDTFAAEMCLKYLRGMNVGPEGRGGTWRPHEADGEQLVWLWFGAADDGVSPPTEVGNAVYACLSAYRPPAVLEAVARKRGFTNVEYRNTHPSYLFDVPAWIDETIYFGRDYALSTMQVPAAGFTDASLQYRPMKLVSTPASGKPLMLLGNSTGHTVTGAGRTPWDQWAQHGNVAFQLTHVPPDAQRLSDEAKAITDQWATDFAASFERRWGIPVLEHMRPHVKFSKLKLTGVQSYLVWDTAASGDVELAPDESAAVLFLRHGTTFLAVRSLNGTLPVVRDDLDEKRKTLRWITDPVPDGGVGGFVVEVAAEPDHGSFDAFRAAVAQRTKLDTADLRSSLRVTYTNLAGQTLVATYGRTASEPLIEPSYDWGYATDPARDHPTPVWRRPPFDQPTYPRPGATLDGWGRVASLTFDGRPAPARPDDAVIRGPHVTQADGVLTVTADGQTYRLDWTGDAPVFSPAGR